MILNMILVLAIGEAETGLLWDGLAVGLGVPRGMLACYASSDFLSWTLADQQRHDKSCVVECTCLHNPNMKLTGPLGRWDSSRWQILDHWYRYAYVESRIWFPYIGNGVGFRVVRSFLEDGHVSIFCCWRWRSGQVKGIPPKCGLDGYRRFTQHLRICCQLRTSCPGNVPPLIYWGRRRSQCENTLTDWSCRLDIHLQLKFHYDRRRIPS